MRPENLREVMLAQEDTGGDWLPGGTLQRQETSPSVAKSNAAKELWGGVAGDAEPIARPADIRPLADASLDWPASRRGAIVGLETIAGQLPKYANQDRGSRGE